MARAKLRKGFTLIEVLISVVLLSMVMLALYSVLNMQKKSNKYLFNFLQRSLSSDKAIMVLYRDILYSDGNISIRKGEFDRLCMNNTGNSLYGLSYAKVCWLVEKDKNSLVRIEGGDFKLPSGNEDSLAIDITVEDMLLFDIARKEDEILIVLQEKDKQAYTFMLEGVKQPPKPPSKKKPKTAHAPIARPES